MMIPMKAFTFPALVLAALSIWTAAAQTRISTIPPLPGKNARSLQVPPYQSFCWFAADRGRWPGDGNRVLPWFGRTAPGNLLDSKPNPSTAKPGDHAMFALFHLKDGNFMAVLPVATPDSLTWLKLDGDGKFLVESGTLGTSTAKPQPVLAVTAVDSELGVVQPVTEIAALLKDYPHCHLHVDATQAVGKLPLPSFEGIDTLSLTAHKFYGLNGIGVLVKRRGLALEPLIHGGESTTIYRSGTPTVALACSLALALDKAMTELPERVERVRSLNARLRTELANYPKVRINSPEAAVPQILNLSVKDVKGTVFQRELDAHGVCVSVKSACSSDGLPSRAVFAVSRDRRNALSSWRISLSHRTTDEEITGFLQAFDACYRTLTQP